MTTKFPDGVTALISSNGSGKSTLIRILCTIEKGDSGSYSVAGQSISRSNLADYRESIGHVPQHVRFVPTLRCHDALAHAGWGAGMNRQEYLSRIPQVLELGGLGDQSKAPVGSLSGGQSHRIGIAAALRHEPSLLFLDEPTGGLDPQARREIRDIVRRIGETSTVLFSTHPSEDINVAAHHVLALHHGCVALEGPWEEALRASSHETSSIYEIETVLAHIWTLAPLSHEE